jgi:glycosyltransferase involved in cell wall biosynthesis
VTVVVHVLEALEGGTAHHVRDLVTHVDSVTHHVVVPPVRVGGVTDEGAAEAMAAVGAEVHRMDMRRTPASVANATAVVALRRLIKRVGADVVHGHSAVGGALARLSATSPVGRTGPGRRRPRRIYTPNGIYPGAPAAAVERSLGALTDHLVAVSESEGRIVAARGIVPADRVSVIHNGIDLSVIDLSDDGIDAGPRHNGPGPLRTRLGLPLEAPVVGFVGRLAAQKNPALLVHAAAQLAGEHPDLHTVLMGDGPLAPGLRGQIQQLSLTDCVHLSGHQRRAASVMAALNLLVLPSEYEGCPYAPLEAMRAGVPVVASDVVGNRDVVLHSRTGLLFPPGDASLLAAAISLVLGDPVLGTRLTDAARDRLAADFDVQAMARATAALYAD